MADAPFRPQPSARGGHLAHQLVGVKAAFHQELALPRPYQLDRLSRSRMAVGRIDQFEFPDIDLGVARDIADFCLRSDQKRLDQTRLGRLDGTA